MYKAARLHFLPVLLRYSRMSERVQHDEQCLSLHDRWCFRYDEQRSSLHAEGLNRQLLSVVSLFWRSAWKLYVNDNDLQVLFFFTEFCWSRWNMLTLYLCRTCCSVLFQCSNSDYIHVRLSWCTDFQNAWHSWVEEWVCLYVFSYILCIN